VIVVRGEGATYGCDQANKAVKSESLGDIAYKLGRGGMKIAHPQRKIRRKSKNSWPRSMGMREVGKNSHDESRSDGCGAKRGQRNEGTPRGPAVQFSHQGEGGFEYGAGLYEDVEQKEAAIKSAVCRRADKAKDKVEESRAHQVEADEVGEERKSVGDATGEEVDKESGLQDEAAGPYQGAE
jgi:hypothetical protein